MNLFNNIIQKQSFVNINEKDNSKKHRSSKLLNGFIIKNIKENLSHKSIKTEQKSQESKNYNINNG